MQNAAVWNERVEVENGWDGWGWRCPQARKSRMEQVWALPVSSRPLQLLLETRISFFSPPTLWRGDIPVTPAPRWRPREPGGADGCRRGRQEAWPGLLTSSPTDPRLRRRGRGSADFQSAVSRICNPPEPGQLQRVGFFPRPAECNSALRQVANLRYCSVLEITRHITLCTSGGGGVECSPVGSTPIGPGPARSSAGCLPIWPSRQKAADPHSTRPERLVIVRG